MRSKRKIKKIWIVIILVLVIVTIGLIYKDKFYQNKKEPLNNNEIHESNSDEPQEDPKVVDLKKETYYIDKNLERYLAYLEIHSEKSMQEVISNVNANIDYEYYTHSMDATTEDKYLMLVNKYYHLGSDYVPDLVEMDDKYNHNKGYRMMERVTYEHFKEMVDDASIDGITLFNISAYRSYDTQVILYNNYANKDGKEAADTYSARPGYSEHQTGMASDINTSSTAAHFENSKEYAWLQNNAYKYGFILRFPKDKEDITGYEYEPWHYRYVGSDAAKYIHEHDITLEEYYAYFVANK